MTDQVKSKQRVADYGEVFTAEREVKAMCDLVKDETERIDSRFLEPACGEGAFLIEILRRKLAVVRKKYSRSITDYEKNSLLAVSSLYGVDILADNAKACRERLFEIWDSEYKAVCGIRGAHLPTNIDDLKTGERPPMPYSDTRLLNVLSHTVWFLPNVAACYAMANLLKQKQNAYYRDHSC